MVSFLTFRRQRKGHEDFRKGWNSCLDQLRQLLREHKWAVDEEDPQEIFCDVCGQGLMRTLDEMRK